MLTFKPLFWKYFQRWGGKKKNLNHSHFLTLEAANKNIQWNRILERRNVKLWTTNMKLTSSLYISYVLENMLLIFLVTALQ